MTTTTMMMILSKSANVFSLIGLTLAIYDCFCFYIVFKFYEKNNTVIKNIKESRNFSGVALILVTSIGILLNITTNQADPVLTFPIIISLLEINYRHLHVKYKYRSKIKR